MPPGLGRFEGFTARPDSMECRAAVGRGAGDEEEEVGFADMGSSSESSK